MNVRSAAVAGRFYTDDADELRQSIDELIGVPTPVAMTGVIVPHAGHIYSGPVAATAYRLLPADAARVVLIGPSHFVPLAGLAASGRTHWRTPLGDVPIDTDAVRRLAASGAVDVDEAPHSREHCLEVQLPFLQRVLRPGWSLIPLVVGHAPAADVAAVLAQLLPGALLVVSTDLSHYLPYDVAAVRDRSTANAIVAADPGRIADDDACGAYALRGALQYLRERRLSVREVDLRSSGDTAGPADRVVGYGSFVICPP